MQISRVQWTFVLWMCRHLSSFERNDIFLCLVMQHKIETDGQTEGLKNFCMNQLHKFAHWWEGWHQCKCRLQNAQREHGVGTEGFGIFCLLLHKQNQQCTWACLSLLDTRQFCRRMLECCVKASDCMHHLCYGNPCNTMRNTPNVRANLQTAPQCLFLLNWGDHELEIRFVLRHDLLNDGAYWWAFDGQQCQSFTCTMAMPCVPLAKVLCLSILVCSQAWCCRNVADIFDAMQWHQKACTWRAYAVSAMCFSFCPEIAQVIEQCRICTFVLALISPDFQSSEMPSGVDDFYGFSARFRRHPRRGRSDPGRWIRREGFIMVHPCCTLLHRTWKRKYNETIESIECIDIVWYSDIVNACA